MEHRIFKFSKIEMTQFPTSPNKLCHVCYYL
jgi:hypothetical protein